MGIIVITILQIRKQSLRKFKLLATGYPGKGVIEPEPESRRSDSEVSHLNSNPLAWARSCKQGPTLFAGRECLELLNGSSERGVWTWARGIWESVKKGWSLMEKMTKSIELLETAGRNPSVYSELQSSP